MLTRSEKNKEISKKIKKEETEKKKEKIRNITIKITVIFTAIFSTLFIYMRYGATIGIIVREYRIVNKYLPSELNGLKIAHISDLYYGYDVKKEKLDELVKLINKIRPDIVAFTGDLINKDSKLNTNEQEELIESLNNIKSSIGKYFVRGENDNSVADYIINNTDFELINNSSELIYSKGLKPILLVGLDEKYDIEKSFSYLKEVNANKDIYSIVLMHKPDLIDEILNYEPKLVLAGHSQNGIIKLPGLGGLIKLNGSKKYYDEEYKINNTNLYITGGIGTNNLKIRLFNRPGFNFYRLTNK